MKKAILMGALALALGAQAQPFAAWSRYREISVNTTVPGAVTNYPVLVRLSNASVAAGANVLTDAKAGGADIRFTDSTGATSLSYEIDSWSSTGAAIWVKIPSIPAGITPKIRLYWGNSAATAASAPNDVFGSANDFVGVWHLGNAAGIAPRPNAVAGAPAATPANDGGGVFGGSGYSAPAGVIGNADALRGDGTRTGPAPTSDYLDIGSPAGFEADTYNGKNTFTGYNDFSTGFSYSAWVKAGTPSGNYTYLLELANENACNSNIQVFRPSMDARIRFEHCNGTQSGGTNQTPNNTLVEGTWQYYTFTMGTGETPAYTSYLNGVRVQGPTNRTQPLETTLRTNAWIGKSNYNGDYYWTGAFDESRISRIARDSNWVKLDYWTQRADSSAVGLGATRSVSARPLFYTSKTPSYKRATAIVPNDPITTSAATNWAISGTLPAGLAFSTTTGVISGTPTTVGGPTQIIVSATVSAATVSDTLNITIIPGDVPGAPAAPTAAYVAGGTTSATVTWAAPTVTGSSAITGYKVTAVQDTTKSCTWTTGALSCVVSGLTATTSYSFQVRAINGEGASAYSAASSLLVPPTAPVAPTAPTVLNNKNASATISWSAPNNGGSAITGYKVIVVGDTLKTCSTTGALFCTITGLSGSPTFQVRAINAIGASAYSPASAATPITAISGGFVIRMNGSSKPFTFVLPQSESADEMTMNISDVWGRTVWSKTVVPAKHGRELRWNGTNTAGRRVGAGMYIVKLSVVNGGKTVELAEKAVSLKP